MSDPLSPSERSARMRLVKSKNTRPEMVVRRLCCDMGCRGYRLHRSDLPGRPDIAFIGLKKAIFVHGCFWHGHDCHGRVRLPLSNSDYWLPKIQRNGARDSEHVFCLEAKGWNVLVIWECELRNLVSVSVRLKEFLSGNTGLRHPDNG